MTQLQINNVDYDVVMPAKNFLLLESKGVKYRLTKIKYINLRVGWSHTLTIDGSNTTVVESICDIQLIVK